MSGMAVVNLMKCSERSIIASNRIAIFLAETIGCQLIDRKETAFRHKYKILIIVNGPMLYCGFREELKVLVEEAESIVWVTNDYSIYPPKFIKEKNPIYWSSCDPVEWQQKHEYINWNQLTFSPWINPIEPKFFGLFYYGAYRTGRERYFKKYFETFDYQVFISSSNSGKGEFKKICPQAKYFQPSDCVMMLRNFSTTIYIEDTKSHSLYCSPANRFYEALSAHVPILFDKATVGTMGRAGIDISKWTIDGPEEASERLEAWREIRVEQAIELRQKDYLGGLKMEIRDGLERIRQKAAI